MLDTVIGSVLLLVVIPASVWICADFAATLFIDIFSSQADFTLEDDDE